MELLFLISPVVAAAIAVAALWRAMLALERIAAASERIEHQLHHRTS